MKLKLMPAHPGRISNQHPAYRKALYTELCALPAEQKSGRWASGGAYWGRCSEIASRHSGYLSAGAVNPLRSG